MRDIQFQTREGRPDAAGLRFGIVASRFHAEIVERLVDGARKCLLEHGIEGEDLELVAVPGAWELPLGLRCLATSSRFDGLVALGVVIRGDTPHFDYVCSGCAHGIQRVTLDHGTPIGFGVLTCDTEEQARERAGGDAGNKGWEAALAALEMTDLVGADSSDRGSRDGRRSGRAS